jgi:hypothetical protein
MRRSNEFSSGYGNGAHEPLFYNSVVLLFFVEPGFGRFIDRIVINVDGFKPQCYYPSIINCRVRYSTHTLANG